jgi:uncharacterized protein YecE (DUF72 family)
MKFGQAEDIDKIDFTLPDDPPITEKVLGSLKKVKKGTEIITGCAKWGRKDWIGKIYPAGTKEKDFFAEYVKHFQSIEMNATHYRIFPKETIAKWRETATKGFKFCPKFPQYISHIKRLKDVDSMTEAYIEMIAEFKETLGPSFLQLPPNFAPKSLPQLRDYLEKYHKAVDIHLELRHPGWFDGSDVSSETFEMLRQLKVGTVITDTSDRRDVAHMRLTTPTAFIRFVGNSLHPTDYTRIDDWVDRVKKWMKDNIRTVYFFMHQHEERDSPELLAYTIKELNKKCKLNIPEPGLLNQEEQAKIF